MVDYDEMLRQHESVLADLDRLQLLVESPPADLSQGRLQELMVNDADSLREDLGRHFAYEEEGGYLRAVLDVRPGLERQVEKLRGHHGEILRGLGALVAGAEDLTLDEIREQLQGSLRLLRAHEAAETGLVHEVLVQDVGAED